jgi:hypothetical protein
MNIVETSKMFFKKMGVLFFIAVTTVLIAACASRSVTPSVKEVKVSREQPAKDCKEMGKLTGQSTKINGTAEQALEDLKREAANKGANYVVVKQYSDYGTAVTGMAYDCP